MAVFESKVAREQVRDITARVTGLSCEKIDTAIPLSKLGIDSLMALSVVAAVEKQFKISIPEKRLRGIKSIDDLIALISSEK